MSMQRPKQEFQFPTIRDRTDLDYIPKKTRNPALIDLLTDTPRGYRTVWQQRIAAEAAQGAVEQLVDDDEIGTLRSLADVLAIVSLGTAYHTFGEPESDDLGYRRIKIARMVDRQTGARTSTSELINAVRQGFTEAAFTAIKIEEKTLERRSTKRDNDKLGRRLATVGFQAAALHDGIDRLEGTEFDLQYASWKSARAASARAMGYAESAGTRFTLSALADPQSAPHRFINDNPWLVPAPAYEILVGQLETETAHAFGRYESNQTLTASYATTPYTFPTFSS